MQVFLLVLLTRSLTPPQYRPVTGNLSLYLLFMNITLYICGISCTFLSRSISLYLSPSLYIYISLCLYDRYLDISIYSLLLFQDAVFLPVFQCGMQFLTWQFACLFFCFQQRLRLSRLLHYLLKTFHPGKKRKMASSKELSFHSSVLLLQPLVIQLLQSSGLNSCVCCVQHPGSKAHN